MSVRSPRPRAANSIEDGAALGVTVLCFGHHGVYVQRLDRWTYVYQQDSNAAAVHVVDLAAGPARAEGVEGDLGG